MDKLNVQLRIVTLGHQERSGGIGDEGPGQSLGHELVRR